jgi:hypothetical protein
MELNTNKTPGRDGGQPRLQGSGTRDSGLGNFNKHREPAAVHRDWPFALFPDPGSRVPGPGSRLSRPLLMQMRLALKHLPPLELDRHVVDAEQPHGIVNVLEDMLMALRLADDGVCAHRNHTLRHGPDVQIVHRFDTGDRC